MYRYLFNKVKNIIPKISATELIALRTGNVHCDRDIFKGELKIPDKLKKEDNKFDESRITHLLNTYGNSKIYPSKETKQIFNVLGKNKFFSFLIPKEYGGIKLSVRELSNILTKISSKNLGLGVSVIGPLGLALVGKAVPNHLRTEAISLVAVMGFSGFFLAPSIMGIVSEFHGLRVAFICAAALSLTTIPLTLLLRRL